MQTFRHLFSIAAAPQTAERARELGQLAYMQWLGNLPGSANYPREAERALRSTDELTETEPAVEAFRTLLQASLNNPLAPLDLTLPKARRRGGSRARRARL